MGQLEPGVLQAALGDAHSKVRAAAVRLSEPLLRAASGDAAALRKRILMLGEDLAADVQIQLALTLGEVAPDDAVKGVLIKALLEEEDPAKPLSDQEIVGILTAKGIPIARRTVAKYRGELGILPCHLRRRF
jgi:hypothetical protein